MDYLGDKLTAAQGHMSQWVGSVRRSLHGALGLLGSAVGRERGAADLPTRAPLKRTSSFRHFASRSRESFRRFSLRSQQRFQSLRKRSTLSTGSDTTDIDRVKHCCITPITKEKDTDALVQERGQFCTPEDKDHYGTYEDRGSSNDELDVGSRNNELECYKDAIPPSPSKDRTGDPQSMSLSSQSEATPASEKILEPKSGLLSCELESTDDTDSSQSTCPPAQDDQTPPRFSFLEPVTTLDSCAQKSRIQLSRKTIRRAPTKHRKGGVGDYCDGTDQFLETSLEASMYEDSTEPRTFDLEELTTQEIKACEKPPVLQCQRVAMFPGMDPAVLKAGLRKTRPAGEDVDESNSKTCKLRSQQSFRVLPPTNGKGEGSEVAVPSWLQELKSKKRLSQLHSPSDQ